MTQPSVSKFSQLVIEIGDGANPEVFTKVGIAMVSRDWSQSVATNTDVTPDEADEDAVVWEKKYATTRTANASGKGKIDKTKVDELEDKLGVTWNYRIKEVGGYMWTGPFILEKLNRTGQRADTWDVDISLVAADKLTRTQTPA